MCSLSFTNNQETQKVNDLVSLALGEQARKGRAVLLFHLWHLFPAVPSSEEEMGSSGKLTCFRLKVYILTSVYLLVGQL